MVLLRTIAIGTGASLKKSQIPPKSSPPLHKQFKPPRKNLILSEKFSQHPPPPENSL